MAKNNNTKNVNKQSSKKNIAGIVIGSVVIAAAVAFGIVSSGPLFGILQFGITALIAAVGVAFGATVIGFNAKKYSNKAKADKLKEKEVQNEQVKEVEREVENSLKNEEQIVEARQETPTMQEFLTNNVGPNTFAIYNKGATEILKDQNQNEMIYNISKDNRFRYALNNFSKEFNELPDCCVVVRDAENNSTEHKVEQTTFRKDMTELLDDIKTVRSQIKEEVMQPELVL